MMKMVLPKICEEILGLPFLVSLRPRYWFLVHLFTKHPEYNRKFYIAGESYAGENWHGAKNIDS